MAPAGVSDERGNETCLDFTWMMSNKTHQFAKHVVNLFHQLKRHPLQNGKKKIEWLIIPVEYTSSNLGNFRPPKPK